MTSDTEARRSVAMTGAPRSLAVPSMVAVSPSSAILAPNRASSCTCMKRFSKIVSVISEAPPAQAISAISCACKSVGKPGNGAVDTFTGRMPEPLRLTRMPSGLTEITAPASVSTSSADCNSSGRAPASCTSPPVIATAIA